MKRFFFWFYIWGLRFWVFFKEVFRRMSGKRGPLIPGCQLTVHLTSNGKTEKKVVNYKVTRTKLLKTMGKASGLPGYAVSQIRKHGFTEFKKGNTTQRWELREVMLENQTT